MFFSLTFFFFVEGMTTSDLQFACREYYLAQQSLRRSEEEQVFLEAQLLNGEEETASLQASITALQENLAKEIRNAQDARYSQDSRDLGAEKLLHTRLSLNSGAVNELQCRVDLLEQQLKREAVTLKTLERSLHAQATANSEFVNSSRSLMTALDAASSRKAHLMAQRDNLTNQLQAATRKAEAMSKSVQFRTNSRCRSQTAMRDWDFDTLRMKQEVALSKGVYSEEISYQEEQTSFLQKLIEENRRLKSIARAKLATTFYRTDDTSTFNVEREPERPPLEKIRESNIRLLQQLTSSLSVLQSQAGVC